MSLPAQVAAASLLALLLAALLVAGLDPLLLTPLAVLPLIALIALRQAFLLGVLFVAFSYFRLHEVMPALMPLKLPLALALGTLFTLVWNLSFHRIRMFWDPLFTPFVLFFALVTLGLVAGNNPGNSLTTWKDSYVKIAIMVFALAWLLRQRRDLAHLLAIVLAAACVVALVALGNKMQGLELVEGSRVTIGRSIGSVLGDPNDLSLVLLFGAAWSLAAMTTRGLAGLVRTAGGLIFLLIAAAIVATQSRGGLLGIAAVAAVFVARRVRSKLLLALLGLLALIVLFALAGVADRQSGGAHEEGIDESAMGRIYAWEAALRMAFAHPLFGVGLDNFYYNYYLFSDFWDGKNHAVHSTWFGVLAETGWLGFGLFVWLVSALFIKVRRLQHALQSDPKATPLERAAGAGLYGGLIGFVVSGTFLTQGFTWPLYIMLALAVGLGRMVQRRPLQSAAPHPSFHLNPADCAGKPAIGAGPVLAAPLRQ